MHVLRACCCSRSKLYTGAYIVRDCEGFCRGRVRGFLRIRVVKNLCQVFAESCAQGTVTLFVEWWEEDIKVLRLVEDYFGVQRIVNLAERGK